MQKGRILSIFTEKDIRFLWKFRFLSPKSGRFLTRAKEQPIVQALSEAVREWKPVLDLDQELKDL
jgi:hypothetical protein